MDPGTEEMTMDQDYSERVPKTCETDGDCHIEAVCEMKKCKWLPFCIDWYAFWKVWHLRDHFWFS